MNKILMTNVLIQGRKWHIYVEEAGKNRDTDAVTEADLLTITLKRPCSRAAIIHEILHAYIDSLHLDQTQNMNMSDAEEQIVDHIAVYLPEIIENWVHIESCYKSLYSTISSDCHDEKFKKILNDVFNKIKNHK